MGSSSPELVFDSKLTTYAKLNRLNQMGITFMTLRRRSGDEGGGQHAAFGLAHGTPGCATPDVSDSQSRRPEGHIARL